MGKWFRGGESKLPPEVANFEIQESQPGATTARIEDLSSSQESDVVMKPDRYITNLLNEDGHEPNFNGGVNNTEDLNDPNKTKRDSLTRKLSPAAMEIVKNTTEKLAQNQLEAEIIARKYLDSPNLIPEGTRSEIKHLALQIIKDIKAQDETQTGDLNDTTKTLVEKQ